MQEKYLHQELIRLGEKAADWQEAVQKAGRLLVHAGLAREEYIDAMLEMVRSQGPYVVITRGLALPHARPEDGALREGFSLVTLAEPVEFGHPQNDPVDVIIAFCGSDSDGHVQMMQGLAEFLQKKENVRFLRQADSQQEVIDYIKERKGGEVE